LKKKWDWSLAQENQGINWPNSFWNI
jgi:hypothetical protein